MFSWNFGRSRASAVLVLSLGVASLWAASGCKPRNTTSKTAPAPSGSAAVATGPCVDYATKFCTKAGTESPTCTTFKEATALMSDSACKAGMRDIQVTYTRLASVRGDCDKLVKTLCDGIGPKTKTCDMVKTQTKNFPPARCKSMLEHVPQIMEDLKKMEAANKPLSSDLQAQLVATGAPSFGPENAAVKLVEFSDFECPFCSRAANVVQQIREKYGQKVHFVFRQFPLPMHSHARDAAQAALAANEQGKFWEFHDRLFKNQQALDRAGLENQAKEAGLDLNKFKKSLDEKSYAKQVDSDVALGEKVQVQGTPTLFVNGARVENPTDFAAVSAMIDEAMKGKAPG